jgi:hypothetical protein
MKWEEDKDYRTGKVRGTEARVGPLRIVVHHYIGYPPERWFVSAHGLRDIDRRELQARDLDAAKAEAIEVVRRWLTSALAALPEGR